MYKWTILTLGLLLGVHCNLYSNNTNVVELRTGYFFTPVLKDHENIWFVKFYTPWCGHCMRLKPEFIKAAENIVKEENMTMVKFGAVNCDKQYQLSEYYGIPHFPEVLIFGFDKKNPVVYEDEYKAEALVCAAKYEVKLFRKEARMAQKLNNNIKKKPDLRH